MGLLRKEDMHDTFFEYICSLHSNPNILINGYFKNPINQRGQQSYTPNGEYTIDRWKSNGLIKLDLVKNGIKITPLSNHLDYDGIKQYIEDFKELLNKKVTLSIKVNSIDGNWNVYVQKNGTTNYGYTPINKIGIHSVTFIIEESEDIDKLAVFIENGKTTLTPIEIEWIKLEIGDCPTPFTPRPYGEELALCQRYYFQNKYFVGYIEANSNNILSTNSYKYPVRMRMGPTIRKLIDQPINNIHNVDWSINYVEPDSSKITHKTPTILNDEMCCFNFQNSLIPENTLLMIRIKDNAYEFDAEIY